MKNLIFFALYLFVNPRLFSLIFKKIYIPVYVQYEWLIDFKPGTVIDVGAYRGYVSVALNYLFPKAQIYAFEPSDEILKIATKNNITVERLAVGDKTGAAYLYETVYAPASSLLQFGEFYKDKFKISKKIKIQVTTLGKYFKSKDLKKPIFLKIDTQGMDGAVLKGAKSLLADISIIHIESPFKELYKDQAFFEDIYNFLTKRGFKFIGDIPDSFFYPNYSLPETANCIFVNTNYYDNLK